jgi:hypothetical protein
MAEATIPKKEGSAWDDFMSPLPIPRVFEITPVDTGMSYLFPVSSEITIPTSPYTFNKSVAHTAVSQGSFVFKDIDIYSKVLLPSRVSLCYVHTKKEKDAKIFRGMLEKTLQCFFGDCKDEVLKCTQKVQPLAPDHRNQGKYSFRVRGSQVITEADDPYCILKMGLVAEETVEVLVPSSLVAYFNYLYEKVRTVGTAFSPQWVYETFFKEGAYIGPPVWPCAMILNTYGIESLDGLQEVRGSLSLLGGP